MGVKVSGRGLMSQDNYDNLSIVFFRNEIRSKICSTQVRSVAVWEHSYFCLLVTPRIIQSRVIEVGSDQKKFGPSSKHLHTGRCNRLTANSRIRKFTLHNQRSSSQ